MAEMKRTIILKRFRKLFLKVFPLYLRKKLPFLIFQLHSFDFKPLATICLNVPNIFSQQVKPPIYQCAKTRTIINNERFIKIFIRINYETTIHLYKLLEICRSNQQLLCFVTIHRLLNNTVVLFIECS